MSDIIKKSIFNNLRKKYSDYTKRWNAVLCVSDNKTPTNYTEPWVSYRILMGQTIPEDKRVPLSLSYSLVPSYYNNSGPKTSFRADENGINIYTKTKHPNEWAAGENYYTDNIVRYNGKWYKSLYPSLGYTSFSMMEILNAYDNSITYHYGDKVSYNGNNYICNAEYTSGIFDNNKWNPYLLKTLWEEIITQQTDNDTVTLGSDNSIRENIKKFGYNIINSNTAFETPIFNDIQYSDNELPTKIGETGSFNKTFDLSNTLPYKTSYVVGENDVTLNGKMVSENSVVTKDNTTNTKLTGSNDMSNPQSTDNIIRAEDYNMMVKVLDRIYDTINTRSNYFTNGLCNRSCQVSCQLGCQLGCQGCNTKQCHNQKCGTH